MGIRSKITLFVVIACGGIESQLAVAQDVLAQIRACAAESDNARRLDCYDTHIKRVPIVQSNPAAGDSFGMTPELARKIQSAQPGAQAAPQRIDKLRAPVAAVAYKPRGEAVITLQDGQVWEQADTEARLELKKGDTVAISRGTLGSFWLSTARASGVRVRRVR